MRRRIAFVICALAVFASRAAAQENAVSRFYSGRQLTILSGFGPGGSASFYAQALSHHIGRFLPGSPVVTVQHMPGAGGLAVANYMANTAPRDGTVIAITGRTAAFEPLMGDDNAKFDGRAFAWIGTANVENTTCLSWRTSPVKTLQDAMSHELTVGGTGADATEVIFPKVVNKIVGTRFKVILGYPSSADMDLAMMRGELEGNCGLGWTIVKNRHPDWLSENKVNILFQMAMRKHPDLPDVPLILDYAKTPEERSIFEFLFAPQEMGRPFFAPPDVPRERVEALREAFAKTLHDPTFLDEAGKLGLEVQWRGGDDVQKIVSQLYDTPKPILERLKAMSQ